MNGRSAVAPSAQLRPMLQGRAWRTEYQNASGVWPDSVRPDRSTMVPDRSTGSRSPAASKTSSSAKIAAFALSVSKIVSTSRRSAPPSMSPRSRVRVGRPELLEADVAGPRVGDVRGDGGGPVRGSQRAGDPARPAVARLGRVRGGAGQPGGGRVHLAGQVCQPVVGLADRRGVERVRLDHVGPGVEVGGVNRGDDVGPREREQVVVAAQVTRMVGEARPPEVGLGELVLLDQRPHGPVEDQDPLRRRRVEKRTGAARA